MKKLLFLLPLLVLTGCNGAKENSNEIKIGLYDTLELCSNEQCETHHADYVDSKYIGKVVYNSVSLENKTDEFIIHYDIVKIERNEKTGFLYYSKPTEQERKELNEKEPQTRVKERTFLKSGYYYSYTKIDEYYVPPYEDPEAQYKAKYWENTDKTYELAVDVYDSWYENEDVAEPVRVSVFNRLYQKATEIYETIKSSNWSPAPKTGWTSHTPNEYKSALLSFYELYTIPVTRTAANVNAADGYVGYNSGWTTDSTQFTNALENYQTTLGAVATYRVEAKASCDLL